MNINAIKAGFAQYLEELNEISNKNYKDVYSDVSIFQYSTEFKRYVAEEMDADSSIFSMSINDILDMEVKNGKLRRGRVCGC